MQRHKIGWIALVLIVVGAALLLTSSAERDWKEPMAFGCLRMGCVMGLVWFAYEQLVQLPRWVIPGILVCGLVLSRWPRLLPLAIAVMAILAFMRPRGKPTSRPGNTRPRRPMAPRR